MKVRARRAGYSEKLTPEQENDLAPFNLDRPDDVLAGELTTYEAGTPFGKVVITLVNGQEADPDTVEPLEGDGGKAEAIADILGELLGDE